MIDEQSLESLRHDIREMGTDYRAEALVSGLIKIGVNPDQIIITPKSTSQRSYRKEVSDFYSEISDYDHKEYLFLHTHRDGLYDALPENIFHQPTRGRTEKNKYETIDEIKRHREEEKEIRKFFLPFEHEYNYVKVQLYSIEEEFENHTNSSKLIEVFSAHWPILKKLDAYHAYVFLRIIPLINTLRNNFELVSKSMSLILGVNIELSLVWKELHDDRALSFILGKGNLGMDTIIGANTHDGEHDVLVKIGPLQSFEIENFIHKGKHAEVIDELLDHFLGANYYFHKEIVVEKEEESFVLQDGLAVLGISSYL